METPIQMSVDSLHCLFNGIVQQKDGKYVIEIPASEIRNGTVELGDAYRVALIEQIESGTSSTEEEWRKPSRGNGTEHPEPPVEKGEERVLTIESKGDEGDGIAKVDRGYVVVVPDAEPGDEIKAKITDVKSNVAFAERV